MTTAEFRPAEIPHAAMFQAPGRPLPLARRLAVHNQVVRGIRDYFFAEQFHEVPVTALADHLARVQLEGMIARGFNAVWCESEILPQGGKLEPKHLRGFKLIEVSQQDLDLDGLCDLAERMLKTVACTLSANLLGGMTVTRLDRMANSRHQRLTYRQALEVLSAKGWEIEFGEELPEPAKATLTRHCGNQPFFLTHLPVGLKMPGAAATGEGLDDAGLKVVSQQSAQWDQTRAGVITSAILVQHPDLVAILCANDNMALGAVAAITQSGRGDAIKVVGFDNISAVQGLIREGRILATADQHADLLAVYGIEFALEALSGGATQADKATPVDLVTIDSLE